MTTGVRRDADMKAVTWQGHRDVSVEEVADPIIKEPNDAIIKVTSTNICGSDLHLYETMGAFMSPGDVLGHEAIGIVLEVGREVSQIRPGDRVVVPFQISCGHCWMCERSALHPMRDDSGTRRRQRRRAVRLLKLYGQVPGGQAEYLRVPEAQFTHILVPDGPPDDRFIYLSDVLPTAWQAVEYAGVPDGGSLLDLGTRTDRRHGLPDRPAEVDRHDHRGGSGGRAAGASAGPRHTGDRSPGARR